MYVQATMSASATTAARATMTQFCTEEDDEEEAPLRRGTATWASRMTRFSSLCRMAQEVYGAMQLEYPKMASSVRTRTRLHCNREPALKTNNVLLREQGESGGGEWRHAGQGLPAGKQ